MKKMIIISFLIFSMLSARQLMVNTHEVMSTKAAHSLNKNARTNDTKLISNLYGVTTFYVCLVFNSSFKKNRQSI